MDAMLQRFLHLWAVGNRDQLNAYAPERGPRANDLFWAGAQAILEIAEVNSRERTLLKAVLAEERGCGCDRAETGNTHSARNVIAPVASKDDQYVAEPKLLYWHLGGRSFRTGDHSLLRRASSTSGLVRNAS